MKLPLYLKRAGRVSGPLLKNTSYSGLEAIFRALKGLPIVEQGQTYHHFGTAAHEQYLENKKTEASSLINSTEQARIDSSIKLLKKHPLLARLMKTAVSEQKVYKKINGVELAYILDIHEKKLRIGADLKTSVITNAYAFIQKAKEYGYFRQAAVYILVEDLKMFFIVVITKKGPVNMYIINTSDHPEELFYAKKEIELLLYFYKVYGKPI